MTDTGSEITTLGSVAALLASTLRSCGIDPAPLFNEAGIDLFVSIDLDPEWRSRKRPRGRYVSRGWIPGNTLQEGAFSVAGCVMTLDPVAYRVAERDAVLFRVIDPLSAPDTARGDYPSAPLGLMRPMLRWETEVR